MHSARHLFHASAEAKQEQRLSDKVAKSRRKLDHPVSASNVFLRDMFEELRKSRQAQLSQADVRSVVAKHHSLYGDLPVSRKRSYEMRARDESLAHQKHVAGDIAHFEDALRLFRDRAAQEPLMLHACWL